MQFYQRHDGLSWLRDDDDDNDSDVKIESVVITKCLENRNHAHCIPGAKWYCDLWFLLQVPCCGCGSTLLGTFEHQLLNSDTRSSALASFQFTALVVLEFSLQCFHAVNWLTSRKGIRSIRNFCFKTSGNRKKPIYLFLGPHLSATGRHLPYGITQCYLPANTSERTPPNPCLLYTSDAADE